MSLEVAMHLYNKGLLCRCTKYERILIPDENGGRIEHEIVHRPSCEGRAKLQALLIEKEDNGEI